MNSLCPTCRKMLYRTDACKGDGVECGRADGGSKKSGRENPPIPRGGKSSTDERQQKAESVEIDRETGESGKLASTASTSSLGDREPKYKDRHKPGYQAQKQREYRARKKNVDLGKG